MPAIDIFQRHPAAAPGAAPAAPKRTLPQRAGTRQSHCTLQRHQHSKVPKHALYRRRPPAEAPCSSTLQSNCTLQWRQHSGSEERATTALCAPPKAPKRALHPAAAPKRKLHRSTSTQAPKRTAIDILEWHPRRNQYPGSKVLI